MAQYVSALSDAAAPKILVDYDPPSAWAAELVRTTRGVRRLARRVELALWRRYERATRPSFNAVVVFAERDVSAVAPIAAEVPVVRIPLAFELPPEALDPIGTTPPTILFVGGFGHPPNVDAARWLAGSIFPRVSDRIPEARLELVGDRPGEEVRRLEGGNVAVHGSVPDVTPYLNRAAVVVAPLRLGGSMRGKVLEALGAGKALVATPRAAEGVDALPGRHFELADTETELVDVVASLLLDPERRRALAVGAREWAVEHLSWEPSVRAFERLYRSVLRSVDTAAAASPPTRIVEVRERFLAPPAEHPLEQAAAPTFSVIVAAHQVADLVGEALDSIRRQTVAPLEVIVCDDGSTDDLEAALSPYRDEIQLIRKEHGGEASAKNAAAKAARGDFVVILDADDVYLPRRLEALTALARARSDLDILTTDAYLVVHGRRARRNYGPRWRFDVVDQRRAILQRNFIFGHAAVRRERLLEHGGFDESILWTTDWDLWLRLILDGSVAGMVDEPLAHYRLRQMSLTARRRELTLGKIATLEKAQRNAALRPEERAVVANALAGHRRELSLIDLRNAVVAGDAGVRRAALDLLAAQGLSPRNRLEAGTIALAPKPFAALLRRRARRSWIGAGGIRVTREPERRLSRRLAQWAGARRR